jgi:hypothetical protein
MSTFYLLPPRPNVADYLADCLHALLPGLDLDADCRDHLALALDDAAARRDVYLVYRDELPPGASGDPALRDGFGALPGDEVVEVRVLGGSRGFSSSRRRLPDQDPPARAA